MALIFPILTQFDDKGAKKADKAFGALAKKFAALFSVAAITKFTKASIKAFAEDEKAAVRLGKTLGSLGLAFEDPRMQAFIAQMERQTGVLDDQLRPAMQSLLQTTGSLTKSQQLLTMAIDVSRGSGVSLETVANDLSRAYVGQTRGLMKYNLGLTQAELKSASFEQVTKALNKQFAGQSQAYLETYAGKVDAINVAYANMSETIGKSLVNAFERLSGEKGIKGATDAIDDFGQAASDVITGVAVALDTLQEKFPAISNFLKNIAEVTAGFGILGILSAIGKEDRLQPKPFQTGMSVTGATDYYDKQDKARKKAEEAAAKRLKKLLADQKKAADLAIKREREAQALKRAGTVFDMENIQIVAALQGRISEDQRLRLTALLAINNKNAEAAEKLSMAVLATNAAAFESIGVIIRAGDNVDDVIRKLINAQTGLALVKKGLVEIPKAKNPFEDWPDVMKSILEQIKKISAEINKVPALSAGGVTTTPGGAAQVAQTASQAVAQAEGRGSGVIFSPSGTPFVVPSNVGAAALDDPRMFVEAFSNVLSNPQLNWQAVGDTFVTNVNVMGSVTSDADLVDMITNEIYKAQKSGKGILLNSVAI